MQNIPEVGKLIGGEARRDAIHVAVAPVVAGEELSPGFHVSLDDRGRAFSDCEDTVGIVDPYLIANVQMGQRFWLFLYPNTVTSLRHVWTHPAFRTTLREESPSDRA